MPNTKSAKKRLRQNEQRRARNRSVKRSVRTQCRKVRKEVDEGNLEAAQNELYRAARALDKAAAKGVIHKNAAARHKSRLSKLLKLAKHQTTTS